MGGSVHQKTKLRYGSSTRVTNTYPRKRGTLTVPRNSKIKFEKGFDRSDIKERIARLKSSPAYKSGESKAKVQLQTMKFKKGKIVKVRSGNLRVSIS